MKKLDIIQKNKRNTDSIFERIEQIKRIAMQKLRINLTNEKAAKIAMDSYIKEAKELELLAVKYRNKVKQDSTYNEASRLYSLAEAISKSYAI